MRSPQPLDMCEFSSLRMVRKNLWSVVDSIRNQETGEPTAKSPEPESDLLEPGEAPAQELKNISYTTQLLYTLCKLTNPFSRSVFCTCGSFGSLQKQHQETTEAPMEPSWEVKTREESSTFGYV